MVPTQIVKKSLVLALPERVWAALTDACQLATWFGAEFGSPFVPGAHVIGRMIPTQVLPSVARRRKAYTGLSFELDVERLEPSRLLSFRWSPSAFFNPDVNAVGTSLVMIKVEPASRGSHLTITESDFDGLPSELLETFIAARTGDWSTQVLQLELLLSGAIDLRPVKD
jgi:uncharacterized protein YndB with AHSA1/START domain